MDDSENEFDTAAEMQVRFEEAARALEKLPIAKFGRALERARAKRSPEPDSFRPSTTMPTLKAPERVTLAEGLALLERHLPTEQAMARLRRAFVSKALHQEPLFAFSYDDAEIDWKTGMVKLSRKRDLFRPVLLRVEFDKYFFEDHMPSKSTAGEKPLSRQLVIAATDILKALGHTGMDRLLLEFDLPQPDVGRGTGLLARATSLSNFAFQNPDVRTAEGKPIAEAIVDRALHLFRDTGAMSPNVSDTERRTFQTLATRQGFHLENDGETMKDEPVSWRTTSVVGSAARALSGGEHPLAPSAASALSGGDHPFAPPTSISPQDEVSSRKIFLVHGRDENAKNEVELFLRAIGLEPIILHKRPTRGRHILTKFRDEAEGAIFAVVLMTPDDEGGLVGGTQQKRARQNVVFELGFFIGVLATSHVAALIKTGVERPSDFEGIGYIEFDAAGAWKNLLAREMKEAGVPFDAHAVFTA